MKQKFLNLLLRYGACVDSIHDCIDYYGGTIQYNLESTHKFIADLENDYIDWGKTSELIDDFGSTFNGTFAEDQFAEDQLYLYYMYIEVYFKNGNKYYLTTKFEQGQFSNSLRFVLSLLDKDLEFESCLNVLKEKLSLIDKVDDYYNKKWASSRLFQMNDNAIEQWKKILI